MSTTVVNQILETLGPSCRDAGRRARILAHPVFNGIDFVEFEIVAGRFILHIHFLNDLAASLLGLVADPSPIRVHGGTRIMGVKVQSAVHVPSNVLDVEVDVQGDFSPYLVSIGWVRDPAGEWRFALDGIDRQFSVAAVNFRPGCPVDFDCKPVDDCTPQSLSEPALDYLARDYASFRQMLLDLVAQRNPSWTERSPADVGLALLELFAHEGDHQSYFQDAVANEAFLDTARQRVSAKRHARLVDYRMHDGRNAWTYVHLRVAAPPALTSALTIPPGIIPAGTQLVTKISSPMRFDRTGVVPVPQPTTAPGPELHLVTDGDYRTDRALAQVRVFETAAAQAVHPLLNELRLHAWGNEQCCLPRGVTTAHVYAIDATAPAGPRAVRPSIKVGDRLLLEEVLGPETGAAADADPTHRCVVRVVSVDPDPSTGGGVPVSARMRDQLFLAALDSALELVPTPDAPPTPLEDTLPLVEITWRAEDAPAFPLCLAAKQKDDSRVRNISVARGNIALADHGRKTRDSFDFDPGTTPDSTFRLRLGTGPLTMRCDADDLAGDVRDAQPAVSLVVTHQNDATDSYAPVADLLSSSGSAQDFVADVDNVGRAVLRFGDGEYGQRLVDVKNIVANYRVGNGRAGNIGADALAHIVKPDPLPPGWLSIESIRNPLPAVRGEDPELIEEVRNKAPAAFRAEQLRAVTELDYKHAALKVPGVAGAVASFRWTGSWYTVFIAIDPTDPENVVTDERGRTRLEAKFKQWVQDRLTRHRLAGYDLEIKSARYVPIDVAIQICVKPGYFRQDVAHAVSQALSPGVRRGGKRGLFDSANFTFGEPVYLSRIYAAVENLEGVESATVTVFHPHGRDPAREIDEGRISIGPWEIARLENDPSNMENGTLFISAGGGS